MVGKEQREDLVVDEKGVKIVKRLEPAEYELPSVEFAIESERGDTAVVRLVDPVPEDVEVADIGFHPEHGEEHWKVENDTMIFERELEPGKDCYTLYGIGDEEAELEGFHVEPIEVEVERCETGDSKSAALREEIPDVEGTENEDDSLSSSENSATPVTLSLDGDATTNDAELVGSNSMEHDTGSVLDALVAEVQERERSDDTVETLREVLMLRNGSIDARLSQLQSEVTELAAYTEALEEFLDENGTGADLIEDFDDRLDGLETDLNDLQETVADHDDEFDTVDASIDEMTQTVEVTRDRMEDLNADLEQMETRIDDVETALPDDEVDGEVDELRAEVREIRDWQDQVIAAFGNAIKTDTDDGDD